MSFHKLPFFFIALSLILGVVLQHQYGFDLIRMSVLLIAALLLLFFRFNWRPLMSVSLLFIVMGSLLGSSDSDRDLILGDTTVVLQIDEFEASDREWNQGVAKALYQRKNGKYEMIDKKLLFYTNSQLLAKGMRVLAVADINPIRNSNNPGSFNAELYWRSKGIEAMTFLTGDDFKMISREPPGVLDQFSESVRSSIISALESSFSMEQAAVLKALLLGDKGDLSTEVRDHFANAGAMHLLAVSGLHVGIIAMILLLLFKQFPKRISNLWAHLLVVLILWFYASITGFSPSVTRAVLMFSLLVLSRLVAGQYNPINVLFFSCFVVVIWNPDVIYDIGFQLSYLAVLGIFLFYRKLESSVFVGNKVVKWLWQGTCVGLAAQITTAPLALYYFHQFPNYFALSNLGVMLMASVLMFTSVLFLISFKLSPLKAVVVYMLSLVVSVLIYFVTWVDQLPWSTARGFELNLFQIAVYAVGLILLTSFSRMKFLRNTGIALLVFFISWIQFDRYQRLTSDHLIFFNSQAPLTVLRKAGKMICFTTLTELSKTDKMILSDYLKVYPGELKISRLMPDEELNIQHGKDILKVRPSQGSMIFLSSGFHLKLILRNTISEDQKWNGTTVSMPYLIVNADHDLRDGAYLAYLE